MIETYVCQRCGREKKVDVLPGQSIEDAKCTCNSGGSKIKPKLTVLDSGAARGGCGCGGAGGGCECD